MATREEVISTEKIYSGKILNLRRDKVKAKDGITYREIVEHNGAVAMVVFTNDGKFIVEKQYRAPVGDFMIEIPAGKIDPGEDPREAAIRELKEETGYTARSIEELTAFYPTVGYSEEVIHLYLCTDLIAGDRHLDTHEDIDLMEMTYEDLMEMFFGKERTRAMDSKSLIGIMAAKNALEKRGVKL